MLSQSTKVASSTTNASHSVYLWCVTSIVAPKHDLPSPTVVGACVGTVVGTCHAQKRRRSCHTAVEISAVLSPLTNVVFYSFFKNPSHSVYLPLQSVICIVASRQDLPSLTIVGVRVGEEVGCCHAKQRIRFTSHSGRDQQSAQSFDKHVASAALCTYYQH